jgi:aminotransferase
MMPNIRSLDTIEPQSPPRPSRVVSSTAEAMSIKFNTKVYELQRLGHTVDVLSLGEAFFDLPQPDFSDLPYPKVLHYSDSRGIPELRESIASYYGRYCAHVDPGTEVLITAGSKAAIYMALRATIDPGDEVLIPEPAWVSYTEQVRLSYGKPVGIPFDEPLHQWEKYVTPRTRVLIVNTPHNPTGRRYSQLEIQYLVDLAKRHGLWLFSDEAYSDFTPDGVFISTASSDAAKTNVAVFNSISKNYGISGWRLGYVIANASLIDQILKVNQHLVTCPATILEYYIAKHFHDILEITKPQIAALLEKRMKVAALMEEIGLSCLQGDSTFYFFVSIAPSGLPSEKFCLRLLEEQRVSVVPGVGYGGSCDQFVRVSMGTEPLGVLEGALRKMKDLIVATST